MGTSYFSLLLLLILVKKCYGNEILVETLSKIENLVERVETLEEQHILKDKRIELLESKIEFLTQGYKGTDVKVDEFSQHLNDTIAETKEFVEEKVEIVNSTIQELKERNSVIYVPETCAQLTLLGLLTSGTRKEKIDPDGHSVNNLPIEVSLKYVPLESEHFYCNRNIFRQIGSHGK